MARIQSSLGLRPTLGTSGVPIATKFFYPAGATIPPGYLLCNGSTFDPVEYPELQGKLGTNTLPNYDTADDMVIIKAKDVQIGQIVDAQMLGGKSASSYALTADLEAINLTWDNITNKPQIYTKSEIDTNIALKAPLINPNFSVSSGDSILTLDAPTTNHAIIQFKEANGVPQAYIGRSGSSDSTFGGARTLNIWQGANQPIVFGVNNTEKARLTNDGLTVSGGITANGFGSFNTFGGYYALGAVAKNGSNGNIFIAAKEGVSNGFTVNYDGTQMIYKAIDGLFGINKTPSCALDVSGSAQISGGTSDTTTNTLLTLNKGNGYGTTRFNHWYTSNSTGFGMSINDSTKDIMIFNYYNGNVGIGGNASAIGTDIPVLGLVGKSSVRTGGIRFRSSDNTMDAYIYGADGNFNIGTGSDLPLIFQTNGSERMRINSSGNVNINGTFAPKKLGVTIPHALSQDDEIRIGSYVNGISSFYGIGLNYIISGSGNPSSHIVNYRDDAKYTNITLSGANTGIGDILYPKATLHSTGTTIIGASSIATWDYIGNSQVGIQISEASNNLELLIKTSNGTTKVVRLAMTNV